MKSAERIQVYSVSLQDSDKEKDYKISYQQIACNNRYISHNECKITFFSRYKHTKNAPNSKKIRFFY